MKKSLGLFLLPLLLSACAHPSYPDKCDAGWFSRNDANVGYWRAYTLPNFRDGLGIGADVGDLYGFSGPFGLVTKPAGALVGGATGLVADALNMTVGAVSVLIINPWSCDETSATAEKETATAETDEKKVTTTDDAADTEEKQSETAVTQESDAVDTTDDADAGDAEETVTGEESETTDDIAETITEEETDDISVSETAGAITDEETVDD